MHRRFALTSASLSALLVLALTGCGSESEQSTDPKSPRPLTEATAAKAWTDALDHLKDESGGRYEWAMTAAGTKFMTESGSFSFDPESAAYERTISPPDEDQDYVVRIRRPADKAAYMQMADWGDWDGCWLRADRAAESVTGIDLSSAPGLPVTAYALLNAEYQGLDGMDHGRPRLDARLDAATALQLLGAGGRAIISTLDRLDGVQVPVTVLLTRDRTLPDRIEVDGREVLKHVQASAPVSKELRAFLQNVTASGHLTGTGRQDEVVAPEAQALIPDNASKNDTCPANEN